jgi:hypothetical protein
MDNNATVPGSGAFTVELTLPDCSMIRWEYPYGEGSYQSLTSDPSSAGMLHGEVLGNGLPGAVLFACYTNE